MDKDEGQQSARHVFQGQACMMYCLHACDAAQVLSYVYIYRQLYIR